MPNKEIWKDIEGYEGLYQVSNMGRVKSFRRKRDNKINGIILKNVVDNRGYICITMSKHKKHKRKGVHVLVAQAFIPNYENKPEVNHINGIRTDNRAENLEWVTHRENALHAIKTNLTPQGVQRAQARFTSEEIKTIRNEYESGDSYVDIAKKYDVAYSTIHKIVNFKTYKNEYYEQTKDRIPRKEVCNERKLTNEQIEQLRSEYIPYSPINGQCALAKKYNLSPATIWKIIHNKTYKTK